MRDLFVLLFTFGSAFLGLTRPWLGVLALAILGYFNPHRFAWGFALNLPVYLIVFTATVAGILFNSDDRRPFPWTRETVLFVILVAWFTVTTFIAPDFPGPAHNQWKKVCKIYMGIIPTLILIRTKDQLRWLIITIALSFGAIGLKGGIFALSTGFNYRVWGPDNTFYGGNNEIALALNMSLPLILLCFKETNNKKLKSLYLLVFLFSICSIISSWSRGGLVTLIATLGTMLLWGKKRWLLLTIPFLLAISIIATSYLPEEWFARMRSIETYEEDASAQGRIETWRYAGNRAMKSPILGGGFETFRDAEHDAHSAYFEILGEHGFIALFLWLNLLFGTMLALKRISRKAAQSESHGWVKEYASAIQIALLAYAVGGAFLGVAYWDFFYHLVSICVILKVMVNESPRTGSSETVSY